MCEINEDLLVIILFLVLFDIKTSSFCDPRRSFVVVFLQEIRRDQTQR